MLQRVVFCALMVGAVAAEAAPRPVMSRRAAIDPNGLKPYLDRGDLALVESDADETTRQLVLLSRIAVPPARVWEAVMNVERYPKFMKTVAKAKVMQRHRGQMVFEWSLDLPVLTLSGVRAMRGKRPHVVEIRGVRGHFHEARERWELFPINGGKSTLVALYRIVDVKDGGLILKAAVELEPTMDQGLNLAAGFVFINDLRNHLEGRPPPKISARDGPVPELETLNKGGRPNLKPVEKLMEYGQLALIESQPDGSLKQVSVMAVVEAPKAKLVEAVHTPEKWTEFVGNLADQKVTREPGGTILLDYELEVPLVNVEGQNRMSFDGDSVEMVAVGGDITRSRWRWEFYDLGPNRSVPMHYAYTDVTEASWLVRKLVAQQPTFEHGIVVAASTIAVRAMKARAEGKR